VDHCDTRPLPLDAPAHDSAATKPLGERVVWMLELFERLEAHRIDQRGERQRKPEVTTV